MRESVMGGVRQRSVSITNVETPMTAREPMIHSAVGRLVNLTTELADALTQLDTRLESVTRQEPAVNDLCEKASEPPCPLAGQLFSIAERVDSMLRWALGIIGRLEV